MKQKDIVELEPELHKVVFENHAVRIVHAKLPTGKKLAPHSHPKHVGTVVKGSRVKITTADGSEKEADPKAGDYFESDSTTHSVENVGNSDIEEYFIEFK